MRIEKTYPSIAIAKDGSSAIELLSYEGSAGVPMRRAVTYFFEYRLFGVPDTRRLGVRLSSTVLSSKPADFGLPASLYHDSDYKLLAEAAIGEYLDVHGAPSAESDPDDSVEIECYSPQLDAWRTRMASTNEEVTNYIKRRLRWSWEFGHAMEEFSAADYLRLRITPADFRRIAEMFSGDDWVLAEVDGAFATLKPTKQLLTTMMPGGARVMSNAAPAASAQQNHPSDSPSVPFVHPERIQQLQALSHQRFDLQKVIAFCNEMNITYASGCYLSLAMLTRALLDHIPPIFEVANFAAVGSNYPGSMSFKQHMAHLEKSARRIADAHLHTQIRKKEMLPTSNQVNFAADIDVLLGEIVRLLA